MNASRNSVKWIDRSGGKIGVKVNLVDGHRNEGQALRAIQQHYRTTIDDMPVSGLSWSFVQQKGVFRHRALTLLFLHYV